MLNENKAAIYTTKSKRSVKVAEDSGVKNISEENFAEITGSGVSLVDFWAPWCYPCRIQGPILEKVAEKIGDRARVCKLNVDESRELSMKLGITGIPTLMIFKNGEKVKEFIGLQQDNVLISSLESFM
jgi:thioredoxin 1